MRSITEQQLCLVTGGLTKDDILDLSALYGCIAGKVSGIVIGGYLGYVNHILLTPMGMFLGGLVGIPVGIAGGLLYGIPLAARYGTDE